MWLKIIFLSQYFFIFLSFIAILCAKMSRVNKAQSKKKVKSLHTDYSWLQVNKNCSRNMFARAALSKYKQAHHRFEKARPF